MLAEQHLARDIRAVLNGITIGDAIPQTNVRREVRSSQEYFMPHVLGELHAEWKQESLDTVFPEIATRKAEYEIEIIGTCIVILDQAMVPTHTWIRVSEQDDEIEVLSPDAPRIDALGQTPADEKAAGKSIVFLFPKIVINSRRLSLHLNANEMYNKEMHRNCSPGRICI